MLPVHRFGVSAHAGRVAMALTLGGLLALAGVAGAQPSPRTGRDVFALMYDAYQPPARWYSTLTFTQRTESHGADGKESVATWYESLRQSADHSTQLRIDTGDPADGNGVLYSGDSLWVVRNGKLAAARRGGNALLPLIEGVYLQPLERTLAQLEPTKVDFSRTVINGRWNDRPVWIVGASSPSDTTSPQVWVDIDRKIVVRAILIPVPGAPLMDIHFENIIPLAGGWLATKCLFYVNGVLTQQEEYAGSKADVPLAAELFDLEHWRTAKHWARQPN